KLREPQTLELCRHPNIVQVCEADVMPVNGVPHVAISMELLPNGSVEGLLAGGVFLSCRRVVGYTQQCLLGLSHAHAQNILHRDIKPGNLMLDCNDNIKLGDFGLAMNPDLISSDQMFYGLNVPPEFLSDAMQPTQLCDIYGLGVALYRLLNNQVTFSEM